MLRLPAPRIAVPIAAAVLLVPWIIYCARTYPWHALYFDHSMYQYTGWAVRHGDRLYLDVAVPDGPFITWLHALIQTTAGESDRAFRWADLVIQTAGALGIGAVLAPYRARSAWMAAIASVWLAQYFRYDWHWTAQREAYYALVGFLGMGILLLAPRRRGRRAIVLSLVGGALVGTQLFGKHIGIMFVALGLVPAVLAVHGQRLRLVLLGLGGVAIAIVLGLVALAIWGDIGEFLFWYFQVPRPYRWIMGSAEFFPLLFAIDRHTTIFAALATITGVACIALRILPRRYLGFTVAPVLFLIAMVLQRKGHIYQSHPVTAGTYLVFAILAMHLLRQRGRTKVAGAVVMLLLVGDATRELAGSTWIDPVKVTPKSQLGAAHVNHADLTAAGRKLAQYTRADDRVLAFGPAGRLLYEAQRHSMIPPFTNFFFNVRRAAIVELTSDQRANLEDIQGEIARRSCPALRQAPPAVVLCEGADWSSGSALADIREICPDVTYVTSDRYAEVGVYGCWHIHVRRDRLVTP